jgi:hypothetical protein
LHVVFRTPNGRNGQSCRLMHEHRACVGSLQIAGAGKPSGREVRARWRIRTPHGASIFSFFSFFRVAGLPARHRNFGTPRTSRILHDEWQRTMRLSLI